jgi:predicted metal-dependent HD superfamily phosphohydrolase
MPTLERWRATWRGLGVDADDRLYRSLIERYSEPHRSYHTAQHLDECFARLDESSDHAVHPHELELALWFHDAVYDTRSQDNEEQSAAWAATAALNGGVSADASRRVRDLVMATKHDAEPATADAKLLVDVDLAILGAPAERFDEYERQVREEYSWVLSWLFRRKRREILLAFLARPHLFNTEYFRATYETQARANLERSVKSLGG